MIMVFWLGGSALLYRMMHAFGVAVEVAVAIFASAPFALLAIVAYMQGVAVGSKCPVRSPRKRGS